MTRQPDVALRLEMTFELPGSPEQVWDAIATANGISSWFLVTDLEEREGGAVCFHMGPEAESPGTVTGWDPPRRFAYEEPAWAALAGHDPSSVTPMVTEFLVEAQSGGTCVVRVVSSAFGTGADWERELFDDMEQGWEPFFYNLRLYLTEFPGQRVTPASIHADLPGPLDDVWSTLTETLGADEVGQSVEFLSLTGRVQRVGMRPARYLFVRVAEPVPGFLAFFAYDKGDGSSAVSIEVRLFSDDGPAFVERETPAWQAWLEGLDVQASTVPTSS
ncbi:MAG: SRPBCC family protein [Acidimicrobiales bacterium]